MSEAYDYLFKFLIIGNAGSGKSCLLHHFIENKFKDDSSHTIGVEFGSRIVNVGGKSVKLQIWDTAGQERFRSVTRSYYRGAAGALLVYDTTSRDSFNSLNNWLNDARTLASPNIVIVLAGNKRDLEEARDITFLEASTFAQENGTKVLFCKSLLPIDYFCAYENSLRLISVVDLLFLETSAKTGENVEETFLKCSKIILTKIETGELDPERIGSGIQFGGAALKNLQQTPQRSFHRSDCACRV